MMSMGRMAAVFKVVGIEENIDSLMEYIDVIFSDEPYCYVCDRPCADCVLAGLYKEYKPPFPLPIREGERPNPNTFNRWFMKYRTYVYRWIKKHFNPKDRKSAWNWAFLNPHVVFNILNSEQIPNEVKIAHFLWKMANKEDGTIPVLGHQRAGKTTTVAWIVENLHLIWSAWGEEREIYFLYPGEVDVELPEWLKPVRKLMEVPNGSVIIVDEASIGLNARKWQRGDNMAFTELSAIAGHKDLLMFFISQHPELLDTNLRTRLATDYILKPMFTTTSDPAFAKLLEEFKYYIPKDRTHTGYYDRRDGFAMMFWQPLPRDERLMNLSKLFSNFDINKEYTLTDRDKEKEKKKGKTRELSNLPRFLAYCDHDKYVWPFTGKDPRNAQCPLCHRKADVYVLDTKHRDFVKVPKGMEHEQVTLATLRNLIPKLYVDEIRSH